MTSAQPTITDIRAPRQSNFEALRVVAMSVIVTFHYCCIPLRSSYVDPIWMQLLSGFARCSVNVFFMLSGWFLMKISWRKLLKIIIYCLFYILLGLALIWILRGEFITEWLPRKIFAPVSGGPYWFLEVYFCLMVFSPLLNKGMEGLTLRQFNIFVIGLSFIGFYSCFLFKNVVNEDGFTFFQGVWMYLLGRCMWLNRSLIQNVGKWWFLGAYIFFSLLGFLAYHFTGSERTVLNMSPFNVFSGIAIFLFFSKIKIKGARTGKVLNYIAGAALGCYAFHFGSFTLLYYFDRVRWYFYRYFPSLNGWQQFGYIMADLALILVISWGIAILFRPVVDALINYITRLTQPIVNRILGKESK